MSNNPRFVFAFAFSLLIGAIFVAQTSFMAAAQSAGPLVIAEFVASNSAGLLDEDGDSSDWIEIHNSGANRINLQGYYLTDDSSEMNKWAFPVMTIDAGERLVVFASNKDRAVAGSELHTNFKLSASGEYIGLSDGVSAIESEFAPAYPQQYQDVSFGSGADGNGLYFSSPTPGGSNGSGIFPYAAVSPTASVARGFYSTPQSVTLSAEAGATIRYTMDGSDPTASTGSVYSAPLVIDGTTTLRAMAILDGSNPSVVETFTYIFLNDVINQATPAGWPTSAVNGQELDFGMDPNVVAGQSGAVKNALSSLPSISIVTDLDNLFDPGTGIFVNALEKGRDWERASSVEWLNADNTPGFQINAGLRIRGGYSRIDSNPKHAFRLYFDNDYEGTLQYPIFGDEGVDTFKKLDLRTSQNYSWAFHGNWSGKNTYLREIWSRDAQEAMGNPHTRSSYVHLYLNGHYWGLFMTQERVSEEYAEDYFGGKEDDYDVIKHYRARIGDADPVDGRYYVSAGNDEGWTALWQLIEDQNVDDAEFRQIDDQVDLDSLIDDQLIHMYSGDYDAVISNFRGNKRANNWYALRDRTGDGTKWRFFAHDAEHTLGAKDDSVNSDRVGPFPVAENNEYYELKFFNPQWLHQALTSNEQYLSRFRYRAWQHLMEPGGALTPSEARARWDVRKAQVAPALLAESARWGDAKIEPPRGVSDWQAEVNWVENNWFAARTDIVIAQLQAQNLAPTSQPELPATVAAKMILNEYNAVDSAEMLQENGSDSTFGQVLGNGGDWFELVTVVDNLDVRGWTLEIWEADNFAKVPRRTDVFEFADQSLLSNLRRGTIVTVAEDVADDPSYDPAGGDWTINLQANKDDEGAYFTPDTQSNFDTNSKNWQLIIRDAAGNLVFGPAGEGVGAMTSGVGNKEVAKLEADPSASITANSAYNDGVSSTFGAPNTWSDGTVTQDFTALRIVTATPSSSILNIEAESARLFGKFTSSNEGAASGGQYVSAPNDGTSYGPSNPEHRAEFDFYITTPGTYAILGTLAVPTASGDSFFVAVNGQPADAYLWDLAVDASYYERYVSDRGVTNKVEETLSAGWHTVTVYPREPGAKLDKLTLVDVNAPAPTPSAPQKTFTRPTNIYDGVAGDTIPHETGLNVAANNSNFSVEYCLQPEQGPTGQWRAVVHKGTTKWDRTFAMWLQPGSMRLHYRISTTSSWNMGGDSAGTLPLNQPTKVTYVRDGNQLKLYLNGVLDSSATLSGEVISNTAPLYIGDSPWYVGTKGMIGDFGVYNEAITPVAGSCQLSTFTHPTKSYDGATGDVIPHDAALDVAADNNNFAVEYCVQPEQGPTGQWRAIVHKGTTNSERTFAMWFPTNSMRLHYRISTTSNRNIGGDSATPLPLNQATKVSYVRDGNQLKLYLNGVLDSSTTLSGEVISNTGPLYIGDSPWYVGTKGQIGDFALYDDVLTPAVNGCAFMAEPVVHLPFGENSGTVAYDISGNDNDGSFGNTPNWENGVVSFDGERDRVIIANSPELEVGPDNFSVAFWLNLKQDDTGRWRSIVHKGNVNMDRTFGMWMSPRGRRLHYTVRTTAKRNQNRNAATPIPLNQWVHVAYVKTTDKVSIYLNGALDSSLNLGGAVISNNGPIYIGSDPWYSEPGMEIDDFRIYRDALTVDQIDELFQDVPSNIVQTASNVQIPVLTPQTSTMPDPDFGDQGASPGINDVDGNIDDNENRVFIPFTTGQ